MIREKRDSSDGKAAFNLIKEDLKKAVPVHITSGKPEVCKCCGEKQLREKGQKNGYIFWECIECSFIFTNIGYGEMVETYKSGYHDIEDGAPKKGWAYSLEFLSPAISCLPGRKLKILDFGCGESYIPDRLRQLDHEVIAVDIVPPLKPHPDRLTGDILKMDITDESFDLIYSYQVFEHIPDPVPVVEKLTALLKKNGVLLIHTDMETEERYSGKFVDWWYVLPPDHCSYFTHKTFQMIFSNVNCRVIYNDPKAVLAKKL